MSLFHGSLVSKYVTMNNKLQGETHSVPAPLIRLLVSWQCNDDVYMFIVFQRMWLGVRNQASLGRSYLDVFKSNVLFPPQPFQVLPR